MISTLQVLVIAFSYVCLLFFIAYYSDKHKPKYISSRRKALVYSFSLAIYCTSWTFYGAVGSASETGWGYLPIYLGPILMYTIGWSLIKRYVEIAHQQNATSISDFIASRYDKSQTIASIVTIIAVMATIPYIALQLKAITLGIQAFDVEKTILYDQYSNAFYIMAILIVYSILFGTRNISVTEHQYGMMNAIAFESIVKLVAFSAIGFFALYNIFDGPADLYKTISETPRLQRLFMSSIDIENFITQTVLAAGAIFCLPRQFHVSVVEYHQKKDLKYARVIFPTYLILFSLFIIPIVIAGYQVFGNTVINTDFYVLFLPISQGQHWLAVLSFIGGLSAATAMVIVATVTLSTMVSNDLILPNLLRISSRKMKDGSNFDIWILTIRRISIALLLLAAYVFYRYIDTTQSLASFGLVSFSAVIQFAPALVLGMFWLRANKKGALAGLIAGTSCWLYFIWPALLGESPLSPGNYLSDQSILTEAVFFSLLVNILAIIIVSINTSQTLTEKIQSFIYVEQNPEARQGAGKFTFNHEIRVRDLISMASIVIGKKKANALFSNYSPPLTDENQIVDQKLIEFTENMLSGVIGAPSARELLRSVLKEKGIEQDNIFSLLSTTSLALRFNRKLLDVTMDNITQGINVIDNDNKLVGWNKSYVLLMDYPEELLKIGMPIEDIVRFNVARGYFKGSDSEEYVKDHLRHLNSGMSFQFERTGKDGRVIEIKGSPLPDGGCVTTYTDISKYKNIEAELRYKEQQIALYTDNVPAALAYIDIFQVVRFSNKYFARTINMDAEEIIGKHIKDIISKEIIEQIQGQLKNAFSGLKQQFESSREKEDGEIEYFNNTFIPDFSNDGNVNGVYFISHDISHLRQAQQALKEININLENRVLSRTEELNNTVLALEQAKTVAEKADQSKTRFMAAASHDLMQPFNAARLFCEILNTESRSMSEYQRELIQKTDQSLNLAGNIIQSLVEFIKLDSGNVMPQKKAFPLQDLLNALEDQFSDFAKQKSMKFKVLGSSHVIYSDPKLLYRIFQNLVSNAMRYTYSGGILVTNRVRGDKILISVWDTGIGIEENLQQEIFEEFKRFHNSDVASGDTGLGLGLSISQRTAEMLGHSLTVKSVPGQGSVFHIMVDKSAEIENELPFIMERKKVNGTQFKNAKILCVDNNVQTLDAMAELMNSWKYDVHTASGIKEIDAMVGTGFKPDILIVDYQLDDGRTGAEFIDVYYKKSKTRIPALFVTANYSDEVKENIMSLGHSLLYKPVKPAELRATVGKILESRKHSLN
ncbi:MAG: PAS-domain containing protein [Alphaproteobacteria bacterium]|nr:PAS-domain containing protein [Alphaproteobacteria bacterium]